MLCLAYASAQTTSSTSRRAQKEKMLGQRGCVVWFTGLSGSGKSTVACTVEHELARRGSLTALLDGDNVRHGLNKVRAKGRIGHADAASALCELCCPHSFPALLDTSVSI